MDKTNQLIFGFPEEWEDFGRRNPVFMERFSRIKAVIDFAMTRHVFFSELIDKFVLMCGRVCIEDFMETLRANISETVLVLFINEQGEKEKGRDEREFSWCSFFGGIG